MTPEVLILIAAVVAVLSIVPLVAIINGHIVKETAKEVAHKVDVAAEVVSDKLEVIREDVNDNMTRALDKIDSLENQLEAQRAPETDDGDEA